MSINLHSIIFDRKQDFNSVCEKFEIPSRINIILEHMVQAFIKYFTLFFIYKNSLTILGEVATVKKFYVHL